MIHAIPFDTLAYAKKLESRGVKLVEAEAHAQTLAEVLEERVSTKEETNNAVSKLSSDINHLRKDMDIKFSETKSELIKWVFAISFAQAALIISVLKFFH
jgi:hypothetical protein